MRRGDPARDHYLDLVRPPAQLFAHGPAHIVDPVGNARGEGQGVLAMADIAVVGPRAKIAVAAGLAEGPACNEQPGPGDQPVLDRALDPPVGSGGIAYGGKAALQHRFEDADRPRTHQGRRYLAKPRQIGIG